MMIVTVYPTKASALNVKHPHGPKMTLDGAIWPNDSFTARRLTDGSVTADKAKAFTPTPPSDDTEEEGDKDEKVPEASSKSLGRSSFVPAARNEAD